jgi:hypothetical protein
MQDSRTAEMLKKVQEVNKKIENGEMNISDMKAEPLPPMNQEGNLSHVSDVMSSRIDRAIEKLSESKSDLLNKSQVIELLKCLK